MDLFPMNGIGWLSTASCGSITLLEEPPIAKEWHFGTLALMPDQSSHWLIALRRYWHADGLFATRHVSSAYCRRLILWFGLRV